MLQLPIQSEVREIAAEALEELEQK